MEPFDVLEEPVDLQRHLSPVLSHPRVARD